MANNSVLEKLVQFAINTEHEMSLYYNRLANDYVDDEKISGLFRTLSKDEAVHREQFEDLLGLVRDSDVDLSEEDRDYLIAMSLSRSITEFAGYQHQRKKPEDRDQLLMELFEFEKSVMNFYRAILEVVGENDILQKIVDIEKSHVVAVMKILITGSEFVSLHDNWP